MGRNGQQWSRTLPRQEVPEVPTLRGQADGSSGKGQKRVMSKGPRQAVSRRGWRGPQSQMLHRSQVYRLR